MRILIKEIVNDVQYYEKLNFIGKRIFDFKMDFVIERLFVLDEEMTNEEDAETHAVVLLEMEAENIGDYMTIKGFSKDLSKKISSCFTNEDAVYFESKIYQIAGDGQEN